VLWTPVALTDRRHTKPLAAFPLLWYGIRNWNDSRLVTVPCWLDVPSENAATYRYEAAPLTPVHATSNVTPVESVPRVVTVTFPGAARGLVEGDDGAAAVIVKLLVVEVPPPGAGVNTLTPTVPGLARSAAEMAARSWVGLTKVVVRLAPFHRTTEVLTKPLPVTVSVTPEPPAAALAGERLVTTGTGAPPLNVAVTVVLALTVTVQLPVPLQAPPQPPKVEPDAGVALRVYWVPAGPDCEQSLPHEIPEGALDTVPEPVPLFVTVRVTVEVVVVEPLTARESVSPPAVKLTLPAKLPVAVGRKRTVTF
jgi:hypothetical protein